MKFSFTDAHSRAYYRRKIQEQQKEEKKERRYRIFICVLGAIAITGFIPVAIAQLLSLWLLGV